VHFYLSYSLLLAIGIGPTFVVVASTVSRWFTKRRGLALGIAAERERLYHELGKQLSLDDLVFAGPEGKPIDPCVLTHAFTRLARQVGLEGVRFHDLRHTFASLMLLRGAKPKVISEALGHSSVAFTMDVYSHIIEGMQSDAMALLDEVLPAGVNKNSVANLSPTFENLVPKQGILASSPCSSGG